MKKKKGIFYGTGALIFLIVLYIGVNFYLDGSEKKNIEKKEADKIYMMNISDVQGVSYDINGQELSFSKKDGVWKYDSDERFPVKQSKLDAVASAVSKPEALRKLEGSDTLSTYGLDKPDRKIEVTSGNGETSVILLGNVTEDGNYYAVIQGENTPYLISSSLYSETNSGLNDLIALEEFPAIQGTDIKTITISQNGATSYYVKKQLDRKGEQGEEIAWYKDSPDTESNQLKDNSTLNVLADSLSSLKVKSCADYKAEESNLGSYGLDKPTAEITYTYEKNGKEKTFYLAIGSENQDSSAYYTRTEKSSFVNEIDKASVDKCLNLDRQVE